MNVNAQRIDYQAGDLLIQFQKDLSIPTTIKVNIDGSLVEFSVYKTLSKAQKVALLHFDPTEYNDQILLDVFAIHPDIATAQFNHFITQRSTIPNDPLFLEQWAWLSENIIPGLTTGSIDATEAWDITTGKTMLKFQVTI